MININLIRERFAALAPRLDERARRIFAASEARAAGYGGIAAVSRATGIAPWSSKDRRVDFRSIRTIFG